MNSDKANNSNPSRARQCLRTMAVAGKSIVGALVVANMVGSPLVAYTAALCYKVEPSRGEAIMAFCFIEAVLLSGVSGLWCSMRGGLSGMRIGADIVDSAAAGMWRKSVKAYHSARAKLGRVRDHVNTNVK